MSINMSTTINTATNAYLVKQRDLDLTNENIQNLNTEGYTRQEGELRQTENGLVFISRRAIDTFLQPQLRTAQSQFSEQTTLHNNLQEIDGVLSNEYFNLSNQIQNFYNKLQDIQGSDSTSRQLFLSDSSHFVSSIHQLSDFLDSQIETINRKIESIIKDISERSEYFSEINLEISRSHPPSNRLLDVRDQQLKELSELIEIRTIINADETTHVYIGDGASLVVGPDAFPLESRINHFEVSTRDVIFSIGVVENEVTRQISGGQLSGLLQGREIASDIKNEIDFIALSFSGNFNDQHRKGLDLNQRVDHPFFSDINAEAQILERSHASALNTGNAILSVSIDDLNAIKPNQYQLNFTSETEYTIINQATHASQSGTLTGAQLSYDGFTVEIDSGILQAGDEFLIRPTQNAARNIELAITNPSQIAIASPLVSQVPITNQGTGRIAQLSVKDIEHASFSTVPNLNPPINIVFTSDSDFNIINADTSAVLASVTGFVPNQVIPPASSGLNLEYTIELDGVPVNGDVFSVRFNEKGIEDHQNVQQLLETQTLGFQERYSSLIGEIGSKTQQAGIAEESNQALFDQIDKIHQSTSGVNSDEEAVKLIHQQQSLEASAQALRIQLNVFSTLLRIIGN